MDSDSRGFVTQRGQLTTLRTPTLNHPHGEKAHSPRAGGKSSWASPLTRLASGGLRVLVPEHLPWVGLLQWDRASY